METVAFTLEKLISGAGQVATGVAGMVPTWINLIMANDALAFPIYVSLGMLALKILDRKTR